MTLAPGARYRDVYFDVILMESSELYPGEFCDGTVVYGSMRMRSNSVRVLDRAGGRFQLSLREKTGGTVIVPARPQQQPLVSGPHQRLPAGKHYGWRSQGKRHRTRSNRACDKAPALC